VDADLPDRVATADETGRKLLAEAAEAIRLSSSNSRTVSLAVDGHICTMAFDRD